MLYYACDTLRKRGPSLVVASEHNVVPACWRCVVQYTQQTHDHADRPCLTNYIYYCTREGKVKSSHSSDEVDCTFSLK